MITGEIKNKIDQMVYDSVEIILARLDKSETEYIKGYNELVRMLEGKDSASQE